MFKLLLSSEEITKWPSLGLLIFFVFFVAVLLWVLRPGSAVLYNQIQNALLADNERTKK